MASLLRPNGHFCPISREVMTDPVVAEDGNTYEREQITRWFRIAKRAASSPITQMVIGTTLVPNTTLKKLIQDYS